MEKRLFTYVILGTLVWAILGSVVATYYFVKYDTYQREYSNLAQQLDSISFKANILLCYGNGTKIWYNNTVLPLGSTAFNATYLIADEMSFIDYGGELGILVTSINRVASNSTHGWLYWHWDSGSSEWLLPDYSCAKYILHEGDTIAFTCSSYMTWPPPPPT